MPYRCLSLIIILIASFSSWAEDNSYQRLIKLIRCPVCDYQSIDQSQAEISIALKNFVRESLDKGLNETQIINHIRELYGPDYVFTPPTEGGYLLFWFLPVIFILCACFIFTWRRIKK